MRVDIHLQCSECKERNYITTKNKNNTSGRIEIKKYCRKCRKHTVHKEVK
jgi:large subunit ribosomal protein L33